MEVIDDNSFIGTLLFAYLTADTAILAYKLCDLAVVS
jgi:hypothetical protein